VRTWILEFSLPVGPAEWWALVWPALAVAVLRASDVTVSVFKTTCVVRGRRAAASGFAGLEAAIWLAAAGIVFSDLSWNRAAGFVAGVAAGTWIGMAIVHHARLGLVTVRVFAAAEAGRELAGHIIAERVRRHGHGATVFTGWGRRGEVHMVLSVVRRREAREVCEVVKRTDPQAFITLDNEPGPGQQVAGVGGPRV
jgi:uncharacterized protein YebE (UPF0316 family)